MLTGLKEKFDNITYMELDMVEKEKIGNLL